MLRIVVRRLAHSLLVVFIVTTTTFFLLHAAPGDPIDAMLNDPRLTKAYRDHRRAQLGYDKPLAEQYVRYVSAVAQADFGFSPTLNRPVRDVFVDAIPRTVLLMGVSLALSFLAGVALGVLQATHSGSWLDRSLTTLSTVCWSMPDFWLALVLLSFFALQLGVLPAGQMCDAAACDYMTPWERAFDIAKHLVLPAGTLTLLTAAGIARFQRGAMLDVMQHDFVRTARAKGLAERSVMRHHVLRNALVPVITLLGLSFPALLGGAVFVERVFSWPGMGDLTVRAIGSRDYEIVLASVVIGSALVCVGSAIADLLAAWANPRLRRQ